MSEKVRVVVCTGTACYVMGAADPPDPADHAAEGLVGDLVQGRHHQGRLDLHGADLDFLFFAVEGIIGQVRAAVHYKRAFFAVDFHQFGVASEPLPVAHEVADDPVLVGDDRGDVIGGERLLGVKHVALSVDAGGRTEKPVRQIDMMREHVDDDAAALVEVGEPVAGQAFETAQGKFHVAEPEFSEEILFQKPFQLDRLEHVAPDKSDGEQF